MRGNFNHTRAHTHTRTVISLTREIEGGLVVVVGCEDEGAGCLAVTEHLPQLKIQSTLIISPPFPSLFLFVAVEVVKHDNYTPARDPSTPHPGLHSNTPSVLFCHCSIRVKKRTKRSRQVLRWLGAAQSTFPQERHHISADYEQIIEQILSKQNMGLVECRASTEDLKKTRYFWCFYTADIIVEASDNLQTNRSLQDYPFFGGEE